jgi:hypothetical protein
MHAFDVLGDPVRRHILESLAEGIKVLLPCAMSNHYPGARRARLHAGHLDRNASEDHAATRAMRLTVSTARE